MGLTLGENVLYRVDFVIDGNFILYFKFKIVEKSLFVRIIKIIRA